MTERNEHTSPDIASFAAKLLKMPDAELVRQAYHNPEQFRSLAASLLTQAPDRTRGQEYAMTLDAGLMTDAEARTFDASEIMQPVKAKTRKPRASKPRA